MQKLVRKYWTLMSSVFLLAVVGGTGWLWWSGPVAGTGRAQDAGASE